MKGSGWFRVGVLVVAAVLVNMPLTKLEFVKLALIIRSSWTAKNEKSRLEESPLY
jgi:hypothetical protein